MEDTKNFNKYRYDSVQYFGESFLFETKNTKIKQDLNLFPYKIQTGQLLERPSMAQCNEFCNKMVDLIDRQKLDPKNREEIISNK